MKFLIKCSNIKAIRTNRDINPIDVYVDNNPTLFLIFMAIPFVGIVILIMHLLCQKRNKGNILIDTTSNSSKEQMRGETK